MLINTVTENMASFPKISLLWWTIILLIIVDINCEESAIMSKMKVLKDRIFQNYDKFVRPINDTGNSTHVMFLIHPTYVVDVDEDHSLFTLQSYFIMHWLDNRLKWEKTDDSMKSFQVPIDMIWKPDLSLWNSHMSEVDPYQDVLARISNIGEVFWYTPATTSTFCEVADKNEVTCDVEVGSWSHDGWEVNLDTMYDNMDMRDFYNVNPRWKVKTDEVKFERMVYRYSCCDEPYLSAKASFPIVRRPAHQLRMVRAPCILVSVLLLALLWVPPQEYNIRVLLGAIIFLVLNVLLVYASATAKNAQSAKDAVALVRSTAIVVTVALIMQVVTLRISNLTGPTRPYAGLIRCLSGPLARPACLWTRTLSGDAVQLKEEDVRIPSANDEWALVASAIDRMLFLIYVPTLSLILIFD